MVRKTWKCGVLLFAVVLAIGCSAEAAGVKVGDAAPGWSGIVGIDDVKHGLDDFKDAKLIVLVFTCNHCPVAVAYEDRLVALASDYKSKGVQFVAVNVNTIAPDRLDKMKERAQKKGFNFPYLYDESQKIGTEYGARVTPHIFVLDKDRKVVYTGAIDDNQDAGAVKAHYLRDALDSLLAGNTPAKAETKAVGCGIKYEKK